MTYLLQCAIKHPVSENIVAWHVMMTFKTQWAADFVLNEYSERFPNDSFRLVKLER